MQLDRYGSIMRGSPGYESSSPLPGLLAAIEQTDGKAGDIMRAAHYQRKIQPAQLNIPALAKLSSLARHVSYISNCLDLLKDHLLRFYNQCSKVIAIDTADGDSLLNYDGSPEHKRLSAEHSLNGSYCALDLLSISFLANDMHRKTLQMCILASSKESTQLHTATDPFAKIMQKEVFIESANQTVESLVSRFCWLDANLTVPCSLVAKAGWSTYSCGFNQSLEILGWERERLSPEKFKKAFRRLFKTCDTHYEAANFLCQGFAQPENYNRRAELFKQIAIFGLATAGIDEIISKLLEVTDILLDDACKTHDDT